MRLFLSLALCSVTALADSIIESSSFGYNQRISPNVDNIPGWHLVGEGHRPQILSDKVILTPLYPGNTRGSIWADATVSEPEWIAELHFRAGGPERPGGNLQLWYVKDGESQIGATSIYTVGKFDGLALAIDTHGGRGGSVRGFLNDGSTEYKSHNSIDSLAFGHCDYAYRNLGRPSVIRLKQTPSQFEVTVDDKPCFQTDKVILPAGYKFGISAATPDMPDSFEIFKFIVKSITSTHKAPPVQQARDDQQPTNDQGSNDRPTPDDKTSDSHFADIRSRLQTINTGSNSILREIMSLNKDAKDNYRELLQKVVTKDQLASLDSRLQRIEQALQTVQRDLEGKDYRDRFNQLHETLRSSHARLSENLQSSIYHTITSSAPRMGFFIFLVISFQILLAGLYVGYKRRRAALPKKFL
ncbi:hypothetical protein Egran_03993 [Elaphomyces granulatus]|uniref:L-type lectin-like domain-containing protein n=1 Tax=Elaphomyces granulatus TaxID=519963 RepID=A0A232LVZ6_9EURO|nr:hypothetical protein Egran_03993 [Elaphomyces granulatus]